MKRAFMIFVAMVVMAAALAAQAPQVPAPPAGAPQAGVPARGAVPPQAPPSQASIDRANQILAESRAAMGGDKLTALKTIVASGRARRVRGNNLQSIEFEINIELPDKYARRDEFPAEESDPVLAGFVGDVPLTPAPPAPPRGAARPGGPPPPTPEQLKAQVDALRKRQATTMKQDFARLALGMFPGPQAVFPLTFSFSARAQAPQGFASVLEARGEGTFTIRYFIQEETHLPIMVSWQAPPTNVIVTVPGQPPPATVAPGAVVVTGPQAPAANAAQADKDAYAKEVVALRTKTQQTLVEYRLYFADYRDVDGVQLPFRWRRAIGTETTEETTFDRYRLNTKIDPKKFELPK